jgi:hypothetical protein
MIGLAIVRSLAPFLSTYSPTQQGLAELWRAAGLEPVQARVIALPIVFTDGSWSPFPGGQARRATACRWPRRARRGCARQHRALTTSPEGRVFLIARASAVRAWRRGVEASGMSKLAGPAALE